MTAGQERPLHTRTIVVYGIDPARFAVSFSHPVRLVHTEAPHPHEDRLEFEVVPLQESCNTAPDCSSTATPSLEAHLL